MSKDDREVREPTPKGEEESSTPYHMTEEEAYDRLTKLAEEAEEADRDHAAVATCTLTAIAAAFRRLGEERDVCRRKASLFADRLVTLKKYMERYHDAVERVDFARRDAQEAYRERDTVLFEVERVLREGV